MLLDYRLSADGLAELGAVRRSTSDKRAASRTKAVVVLATGYSAADVGEILQDDSNSDHPLGGGNLWGFSYRERHDGGFDLLGFDRFNHMTSRRANG